MFIRKKSNKVVASKFSPRKVKADDEVMVEEEGAVEVEPEATELLFETEDVAQLVAEVTGEDVEVAVDDETGETVFSIGEDDYTVTPEGDEEVLESTKRPMRGKSSVKASSAKKNVRASRTVRTIRK